MKGIKIIKKCCPDCGSTNTMHNSWCRVHLTPSFGIGFKETKRGKRKK